MAKIPRKHFHTKPKGIAGLVFGVAQGGGFRKEDDPFRGAISSLAVSSDEISLFLGNDTMARHLPRALEIIIDERNAHAFPFADRGLYN